LNPAHSLLVATRNGGKLRELRQLLADLPLALFGLDDFPTTQTVPETGLTFVENASLKASGYATQVHILTLADDSGLEVDALDGAPGVLSARFAGEAASDAVRIEKLLAELSNMEVGNRSARFVSAIAIASSEGSILNVSQEACEGHIDFALQDGHGFGYDPVFIPRGYSSTFAELAPSVKNRISHRARALQGARDYLRALTSASGGG
jgi:XTP/dITP diphosphohydrolase